VLALSLLTGNGVVCFEQKIAKLRLRLKVLSQPGRSSAFCSPRQANIFLTLYL